jgi:hypothetical protein
MRTTLGQPGGRGHAKAVLATLATAILVAACGASATASPPAATAAPSSAAPSVAAPSVAASSSAPSASASQASAAPSAAPSAAASFTPPNLTGQTIRITVGAAPDPGDTKVQLISDILQKWGATTPIINQTGEPAAIRVLLAGQADIGSIAVSTAINSGLMIFGPSQPRLEYHFIGAPAIKTIADLPGHTYGTSNVHGL